MAKASTQMESNGFDSVSINEINKNADVTILSTVKCETEVKDGLVDAWMSRMKQNKSTLNSIDGMNRTLKMSPNREVDILPDSSDIIVVSSNECKTNRSKHWSPNTISIKSEVRRIRSNCHSSNGRESRRKSRSKSRNRYRYNSGRSVRSRSRSRNFSGRTDRSRSRSGTRFRNASGKMNRSRSRSSSVIIKSRSPFRDEKIKTDRHRSSSGSPKIRKRKHPSGNKPSSESKKRISSGNKNHLERKRKYSSGSRSSGSKTHDPNDSDNRSKSPALVKDANIALSLEISSIMEKISESKTTENVETK